MQPEESCMMRAFGRKYSKHADLYDIQRPFARWNERRTIIAALASGWVHATQEFYVLVAVSFTQNKLGGNQQTLWNWVLYLSVLLGDLEYLWVWVRIEYLKLNGNAISFFPRWRHCYDHFLCAAFLMKNSLASIFSNIIIGSSCKCIPCCGLFIQLSLLLWIGVFFFSEKVSAVAHDSRMISNAMIS